MSIIKTKLHQNLQTVSVVEGRKNTVSTAFVNPREDMNPGELLAAALAACMLTMIGYQAAKKGENVIGTELAVEPVFDGKHSRIVQMNILLAFPSDLSQESQEFYARMAQNCPVHNSLREDIVFHLKVKQ